MIADRSRPCAPLMAWRPLKRSFAYDSILSREQLSSQPSDAVAGRPSPQIETAEFEIFSIEQTAQPLSPSSSKSATTSLAICAVSRREERVGSWRMEWSRDELAGMEGRPWDCRRRDVCTRARPSLCRHHLQALGGRRSTIRSFCTAPTIGEPSSMARLASTSTATTAWRPAISITMDSMISTSASPPVCPTAYIAIGATAHSRT